MIRQLRKLLPALLLLPSFAFAQPAEDYKQALLGPYPQDRWDAVLKLARAEGEVRWWMWNGDKNTNLWVDEFAARQLWEMHGIRLRRVGVNHPSVFMDKMQKDMKDARANGQIDLIWINGENFRVAREKELLWGPFAQHLPNFTKYVNAAAWDIAYDFGQPTQGFETPYSRAQLVLYYDSARVKQPPTNLVQLVRWVRENPGRFTYPDVEDHTGSAFVRSLCYHTNSTGSYQFFLNAAYEPEVFDRVAVTCWAYLNGLKPYLWKEGKKYPASVAEMDDLFQKGEVDFALSYSPLKGPNMVKVGAWPDTVRSFIFSEGTVRNANFVAIPFNAQNKAAALVLANMIMSPEFQVLSGTMMGIEYDKLSAQQREVYDTRVGGGKASIPPSVLSQYAVPEAPESYVRAIEAGWRKHVRGEQK